MGKPKFKSQLSHETHWMTFSQSLSLCLSYLTELLWGLNGEGGGAYILLWAPGRMGREITKLLNEYVWRALTVWNARPNRMQWRTCEKYIEGGRGCEPTVKPISVIKAEENWHLKKNKTPWREQMPHLRAVASPLARPGPSQDRM